MRVRRIIGRVCRVLTRPPCIVRVSVPPFLFAYVRYRVNATIGSVRENACIVQCNRSGVLTRFRRHDILLCHVFRALPYSYLFPWVFLGGRVKCSGRGGNKSGRPKSSACKAIMEFSGVAFLHFGCAFYLIIRHNCRVTGLSIRFLIIITRTVNVDVSAFLPFFLRK